MATGGIAADADALPYAPSAYVEYASQPFGRSHNSTSGDDDDGPERLFAILEGAVPRPDETSLLSPEELQRRRELVDHTWDQVRRWLWAHERQEDRAAAAYIRGEAEVTPLHLMCKLNNPPTDIISSIVEAAPEVASWVDSHGWLPLHHACANGVTTEVLQVLTSAYQEGKVVQDNQNRTPLHFYATRNADNPTAMATNVQILSDSGAAELPDRGGMLPMHYACAYGTNPLVLKVLADAFPDSLAAKESKGRTPMHLAMVNAHRDASPGVLEFLLEASGSSTVNLRDLEGNLPLHLLNLGLRGLNLEEQDKRNNVAECLKKYIAAEPDASPDFLAALQDLPDWLQDVAVVSPHVRNILNQKIIQRFPTSILMLDGYMLMLIIVCFEITTKVHIDIRFPIPGDTNPPDEKDVFGALILLFLGAFYFLARELIQVVALWSLGSLSSWFYDTTNWLDMAVITLVSYYAILMASGDVEWGIGKDQFRAGCAFTKGVLWTAVIYFLKSTQVDFAVFLGGVFYVVQRLVAFLSAVCVILLAFAQMFFIVYRQEDVCSVPNDEGCDFPHCSFENSLLKVYTMMMGEIGSETRYDHNMVAQILYVAYAFLVVILLSNVLIAIVTDSYEIIQNDRAAIVFWSNRLDFVAEMDGIASVVRQRILCMGPAESIAGGSSKRDGGRFGEEEGSVLGIKDPFSEAWRSIMLLFEPNFYDDVDLHPSKIEFWVYVCYQGFAMFVIIPIWIIAGIATAGVLWPSQVREYLFVQKETAISRAEIERQKLEQLREIQGDIKTLKTEIRKEMANDREDMIRMKNEVEAVQSEVLSDLQQVKELMTTLLDQGGEMAER
eukprot:Nitzschia sp. Nitz4//scaffold54_size114964//41440//44056//NITZ4_003846-RA/size114964-augustus-gene-0.18-mRNA-1//-1//CDS//3329554336//4956//frame0